MNRLTQPVDDLLCGRDAPGCQLVWADGLVGGLIGGVGMVGAILVGVLVGFAGAAIGLAAGLLAKAASLGRVDARACAYVGWTVGSNLGALAVNVVTDVSVRLLQLPTRLLRGGAALVDATIGCMGADAWSRRQDILSAV